MNLTPPFFDIDIVYTEEKADVVVGHADAWRKGVDPSGVQTDYKVLGITVKREIKLWLDSPGFRTGMNGTGLHEFFHALGFQHQYNVTHSITSYSNYRTKTYDDINRLIDAYK